MTTNTAFRTAVAATVVFGGLALSACSVDVTYTPDPVPKEKIEQTVSDGLTKSVGKRPDKVECPGPLEAKQGAAERCVLTAGPTRYGVSVFIGQDKKIHAQVDDKPMR